MDAVLVVKSEVPELVRVVGMPSLFFLQGEDEEDHLIVVALGW